jgi:hypothetical protein
MESVSIRTGKVFTGKLAETMVRVGVAKEIKQPKYEVIGEVDETAETQPIQEKVKRTYKKKK